MIKEEWEKYYQFLENLRQTGVTNMFGAGPYLEEMYGLSAKKAREILTNWMENYSELTKKYNWGN